MTADSHHDKYDENSVFNRLLAEKPKTPETHLAAPLERVFETAKEPAHEILNETINVKDFLPVY